MNKHIQFMEAFLAGLRSLPNPDKYTQAYIRAFEMCLYSARNNHNHQSYNLKEESTNETVQVHAQ